MIGTGVRRGDVGDNVVMARGGVPVAKLGDHVDARAAHPFGSTWGERLRDETAQPLVPFSLALRPLVGTLASLTIALGTASEHSPANVRPVPIGGVEPSMNVRAAMHRSARTRC